MKLEKSWLIVGCIATAVLPGCTSQMERGCQTLEASYVAEQRSLDWKKESHPFATFDHFYSRKLNTCVVIEKNEMRNEFIMVDAALNFLKERQARRIFDCREDGVNSVIIGAVQRMNGFVFGAPYKDYLDNMEGGLPAALKTPPSKYTVERCRSLLNRRVNELR